jgi:hypothetical protein
LRIPPGIAVVRPPVVHAEGASVRSMSFASPANAEAAADPPARPNLRLPPLFGNGTAAPALKLPASPTAPSSVADHPVATRPSPDSGAPAGSTGLDQAALQALFHTDESLDLRGICLHAAALPAVHGCLLLADGAVLRGGAWPAELDLKTLRDLRERLSGAAAAFPGTLPGVQAITLHTGALSLSFFDREPVCLCIVHSARGFLPGVREKLTLLAERLGAGFQVASG